MWSVRTDALLEWVPSQPPPSHLAGAGSGKPDRSLCVCVSLDGTKGRSESDTQLCRSEKMKSRSSIAQPRRLWHPSRSLCTHLAGSRQLQRGGGHIYQDTYGNGT